jgi:hypothetical protein
MIMKFKLPFFEPLVCKETDAVPFDNNNLGKSVAFMTIQHVRRYNAWATEMDGTKPFPYT